MNKHSGYGSPAVPKGYLDDLKSSVVSLLRCSAADVFLNSVEKSNRISRYLPGTEERGKVHSLRTSYQQHGTARPSSSGGGGVGGGGREFRIMFLSLGTIQKTSDSNLRKGCIRSHRKQPQNSGQQRRIQEQKLSAASIRSADARRANGTAAIN